MKALFKLKSKPYNWQEYLTSSMAQNCYKSGKLPWDTYLGSGSAYVSCGFYTKHLTFSEWLDHYHIKICD